MEKAIEIKRRAQRCIQNGDLDGALTEYEKLVGSEETDPYNYVLLADLLYKKGDHTEAADRYLSAVASYEKASLFKNAIAVCKKMMRLSLSPAKVLYSLAGLHALDGLAGEAALYYVQYAEHMVRSNSPEEAANALRRAFDVSQDNIRVLEQLSEAWLLAGNEAAAAEAMKEAASHYRARGSENEAERCTERAAALSARAAGAPPTALPAPPAHAEPEARPTPAPIAFEPGALDLARAEPAPSPPAPAAASEPHGRMEGLESRHSAAPAPEPAAVAEPVAEVEVETPEAPAEDEPEVVPTLSAPGGPVAPSEFEVEPAAEAADEAPEDAAGVYEIDASESSSVWEPAPPSSPAVTHAESPAAPGLAPPPAAPVHSPEETAAARVEHMLVRAQDEFRAGQREQASSTLAEAAQIYESIGRLENAATIYRSLGRGAYATPMVMEMWLGNCERRGDATEAAQVACELGDRALSDGDDVAARGWFERALVLDHSNETAQRRLQRLGHVAGPAGGIALATFTPAEPGEASGEGRVEVAVGRAEAVTFDLAGLLAEFQRGVEQQLAGDAQSHYDLGMTYREMGLLEQSMESFRVAQGDPAFTGRASEMIGRCLADQGRWAEAVGEYRRALGSLADEADGVALRFHYGGALSELGENEEALAQYEQVAARAPEFEDVHQRILALRRVLGRA